MVNYQVFFPRIMLESGTITLFSFIFSGILFQFLHSVGSIRAKNKNLQSALPNARFHRSPSRVQSTALSSGKPKIWRRVIVLH